MINRWMKASVAAIVLVLIVAAAGGIYGATADSGAGKIPDTTDAKAIMATIEQAHYFKAVAARNFDISRFPEVFIDTPDFEPDERQKAMIQEMLGSEAIEKAGYLSYMRAYYLAWKDGARLMESIDFSKLSMQEKKDFLEANSNKILAFARKDPIGEIKLTFESIEIKGDRAVVRYDSPSAYQEAILIKVNGKWFVANITTLKTHV